MSSSRDFVPLDRTFRALPQKVERDDYDVHNLFLLGEPLKWADLLQRPRVVILSEAGAGKTWEIREVACRLRSEGKAAFFLSLEYAADNFESAFEEGNFVDFEAWLSGSRRVGCFSTPSMKRDCTTPKTSTLPFETWVSASSAP